MKTARRKASYCLIASAALLMVLLGQPALATLKNWAGSTTDDNWANPNNWNPAGVPVAGDTATLFGTTATYNNPVNPLLNSLRFFNFTLNQAAFDLSAGTEDIGQVGFGTYNQSGGTNTVTFDISLGGSPGKTTRGTYNKTGGFLSVGRNLNVGYAGPGSFIQANTGVVVGRDLNIGLSPDGGTYTMLSGNLAVGGDENVGWNGTGAFSLAVGNHAMGGNLNLGRGTPTSSGSYTQSSGNLLIGKNENIGLDGNGTFTQDNGTHRIYGDLTLAGNTVGKTGNFTLNGGSLAVDGLEIIGRTGNGVFTQSDGTHTVTTDLILGSLLGSTGTYTKTGGFLSVGQDLNVGYAGRGSFTQANTGVVVTRDLNVSRSASGDVPGVGTYTILSGNLAVGGDENVGWNGAGTFSLAIGNHAIGGNLNLGRETPNSSGFYTQASGNLLIGKNENIGLDGNGTFAQGSGTHRIYGDLTLAGNTVGKTGIFTLNGGSLAVDGLEIIGQTGSGVFTQSGGTHTVAKGLTLAQNATSRGTYNLTGGSLSAGTIRVNSGGTFNVKNVATQVNGDVVNNGVVATTNATVTWNGTFTNNGAYTSDPSTQTFNKDLIVGTTGYLVGLTSQDLFIFTNNFQNQSTQSAMWNTANAEMQFVAGASNTHNLYIPGVDNGRFPSLPISFSWYALDIGAGQTLNLIDGNTSNASTALYVGEMLGAMISGTTVTNIVGSSNPLDPTILYYDKTLPANAYLSGLDYTLASGYGELRWDPPGPEHAPPCRCPPPCSFWVPASWAWEPWAGGEKGADKLKKIY